jgi:hypothetical protein
LKTHLITTSYNFLQHFYTSKRKKNTIRRVPSHFTDFKQCIIYFFPFSFVSLVGQNNNGNKCGGYFSSGGANWHRCPLNSSKSCTVPPKLFFSALNPLNSRKFAIAEGIYPLVRGQIPSAIAKLQEFRGFNGEKKKFRG